MTSTVATTAEYDRPDDRGADDRGPDDAWGHVPLPGWGIWFDLTPPELVNARHLKRLRRWILVALVAAAVLVAAAYGFGMLRQQRSQANLAGVQAQTAGLTQQQQQYGQAIQIEAKTDQLTAELTTLTAGSVDAAALLARIPAALPPTMTITQLNATADAAGSAKGAAAASGSADSLDTSGATPIGTLTITGAGQSIGDLPNFVARLGTVPGFADVIPASNQVADGKATYTVNLTLTDQLMRAAPSTGATAARPSAAAARPTPSTTGAVQ